VTLVVEGAMVAFGRSDEVGPARDMIGDVGGPQLVQHSLQEE
jgi:hypothetical protein